MVFHSANAKKVTKVIKGNKCPTCSANVSRAADLSRHMLIHSPHRREMMHQCPWKGCEYATLQKANLNTHINAKHTHDKRFPCQVCHKTFNDPSAVIRHRKRIHKMNAREFRRYCELKDSDSGYESNSSSPTPEVKLDTSELLAFDVPSASQSSPIDICFDAFESSSALAEVETKPSVAPETYTPAPIAAIDPTSLAMFDALWSQDGQPTSATYDYNTYVHTPLTPRRAILPMPEGYQQPSSGSTSCVYDNSNYTDFQYSASTFPIQAQSPSYGYQNNAFDYSAQSYDFAQPQQSQQPQFDLSFDIPSSVSTAMPEGDFHFDSQELEYYLALEYVRLQQQQQPEQWPAY
ncbi:hypothetical protein CONPUDRAFT_150928 [Coniophora puteana RWD-64-598 SS2]|uniref:C2H2-type domain-containing protein n=1 Tax=Coniophora puteana (strain RWD-64-598) TaxID=741705 RepID=A0A5M3MXI8_CONPW|nr:uncharacterized protein CONPUDRAFT_150928 [Coniophora puteana RWD-64-598 SS2]EIW83879.1 hypothetical protein CONPUDRAFT_150928 [Coniophora puteana RWD-64-598 SS2]